MARASSGASPIEISLPARPLVDTRSATFDKLLGQQDAEPAWSTAAHSWLSDHHQGPYYEIQLLA